MILRIAIMVTLFCASLPLFTTAKSATRAPIGEPVVIEGMLDCGQWVNARKTETSSYFEHYLLGLINGLVLGRNVEFWKARPNSISRESVYLWMDEYCRKNPLESVVIGATVLFKERSGWQP